MDLKEGFDFRHVQVCAGQHTACGRLGVGWDEELWTLPLPGVHDMGRHTTKCAGGSVFDM